jgi:hypothetical protein
MPLRLLNFVLFEREFLEGSAHQHSLSCISRSQPCPAALRQLLS